MKGILLLLTEMSLQTLRDLAKNDPALARKFNLSTTTEALILSARDAGVTLTEADIQGESDDLEIDSDQLSQVTGGMRSMGGFSMSSFKSTVFRAEGAHTCNTRDCDECNNCGAHSCSTRDCKECNSCSSSSSSSLTFF
jgi:predicted ribosomally synthesized peptide with nif11-like leader